ncbi:hypothetical protein B0H67DRAFT_602868 [Lasiosphaeris hirsuta]|uniref:Uncharacterized protein n=1 Tax=Lasiosphaeris hirsuta TaxID=260670 RepID=A0AA40DLH0_9PEZI|nr:hypothetical protein B0H67DRAFT_602868 [Lasiosphaeris hirsuta]
MKKSGTASTSVSTSTSVGSKQGEDPGTVRFTNVQDLFNMIDRTTRDSLTVINVSFDLLTKIDRIREEERRKFRFRYFDTKSQILIITIITTLHEQLHKLLYNEFIGQVRDMGLKKSWIDIGSATLSAQDYVGRRGKEGDSSGGPKPERAGKSAWPTLIIEAGVSQTLVQLRIGMRRWFSMSNHEVKIVLLTKFDGTTTLLGKWEEEIPVRPGATTTRHSLQHQEPMLQQTITITRDTTTDPISYYVTSGALVLSFRLLFLRDPGPGERDLTFGVQELEEYAEDVWVDV